jgi:uncharacterized membrane protein YphA (DoxX/SURF4 family)
VSRLETGPRGRLAWAFAAPLALLVLVGVVVVASSAHTVGRGALDSEAATGAFATLLFALGAVWVAALLVASPLLTGLTARAEVAQRRRWSEALIVLLLVLSLLLILSGAGRLRDRDATGGQTVQTIGQPDPRGRGAARPLDTPPIDWVIVFAVFGAALAAFASVAGMMIRGNRHVGREIAARTALAEILGDTLDDLRAEADPRKAVIAAYSRMERSLASFGLPRRPFEAPVEYLGRVLEELRSGSPAAKRLTHLFERAKFSQHRIDSGMKDEAIEAVSTLRDELTAETAAELSPSP